MFDGRHPTVAAVIFTLYGVVFCFSPAERQLF